MKKLLLVVIAILITTIIVQSQNRYDLNKDGHVNALDITYLERVIAGVEKW